VRVEHRLEAAGAGDLLGTRDAVGPAPPPGVVEPEARVLAAAARVGASRLGAAVAEDRVSLRAARGLEELERAAKLGEVLVPVLGLAEAERAPAAREREAVPLEARSQLLPLAQVPRRSQLGALVARRRHLAQELLGPGDVREDPDRHLEGPVRERRVRHPHASGRLRLTPGEAGLRRRLTTLAAGCCARGARPYLGVLSFAPRACLLCRRRPGDVRGVVIAPPAGPSGPSAWTPTRSGSTRARGRRRPPSSAGRRRAR